MNDVEDEIEIQDMRKECTVFGIVGVIAILLKNNSPSESIKPKVEFKQTLRILSVNHAWSAHSVHVVHHFLIN